METRDQQPKPQQRRPLTEEEKRRRAAARQRRLAEEQAAAEKAAKKRKRLIRTLLIVAIVLALATVAGFFGYRYFSKLRNDTASFFETANHVPTATPTPQANTGEATNDAPAASTTPDSEYDALMQQADTSMMQNIVNVLLIGVDYAEERLTEKWLEEGGSTAEHADVMIVLAINFDEQTVDMISLPRDTYAKIPGVTGIYKLNASLDCGGGMPDGFGKVCEATSWMLGGIPVDYYREAACIEMISPIGDVGIARIGHTWKV